MAEETIDIRLLTAEDYRDLKESMMGAYADMPGSYWREGTIQRLIQLFPDGQIAVTVNGKVVGCALSIIVDYEKFGDDHTYEQITGYVYKPSTKTLRKFIYQVTAAEQGGPTTDPATLEEILTGNYASFVFKDVADHVVSVDSGGVFLVRQTGQSGILAVESQLGEGTRTAVTKKLIEASFFIRG